MKATETGVVGLTYRMPSVKVIEVQVQSVIAGSVEPGTMEGTKEGGDIE